MNKRRKLFLDKLEKRIVLSASPWQNPIHAMDVNHDSYISPIDALLPINAMNQSGSDQMLTVGAPPILAEMIADVESYYMDANGDGYLSPADALGVINLLAEGEFIEDIYDMEDNLPNEPYDLFGDTPDTAVQLDLDWGYAFIESEINNMYDVDAFQFIAEDDRVAIDLFNEGLNSGLLVELLNEDMELVASAESGDDYQWCEGNIDVPVELDSTYYVMVSALNTEGTGHYVLDLFQYEDEWWEPESDAEFGDDIHGNTLEDATRLDLDWGFTTIHSHLDYSDDLDQFSVEVTGGQLAVSAYHYDYDNLLRLSVTDDAGNLIGLTQGNAEGSFLELTVTDGTYYVAINSLDEVTASYSLDVSHWSDEPWMQEADSEFGEDIHINDLSTEATTLIAEDSESSEDSFLQRISHIDYEGDVDVFQFEATHSFVAASVYGTNWDFYDIPDLSVFNQAGEELFPEVYTEYDTIFDEGDEFFVRDTNILEWEDETEADLYPYLDPYLESHVEEPEIVICWEWPGGIYPVQPGATYYVAIDGGYRESTGFIGQYSLELHQFDPSSFDPYYGDNELDSSNDSQSTDE